MGIGDCVALFIICSAAYPALLYAAIREKSKLRGLFVGLACAVNAFAAYCLIGIISF